MNMPKIAIVSGDLLVFIGAAGFVHAMAEGKAAYTALIPSFVGVLFVALGIGALVKPSLRKHLMHGLAMLALLGTLGAAGRLVPALVRHTGSPVALASQAAMALICLVTLVLCVKSFVDARRARELPAASVS